VTSTDHDIKNHVPRESGSANANVVKPINTSSLLTAIGSVSV
jgi:hypothetical protein